MSIVGPKRFGENPTQIYLIKRNGTEFLGMDQDGQPVFIAIEDLMKVANIEGAATQVEVDSLDGRMSQAEGDILGLDARLDLLEGQWITIDARLDAHDILIAGLASGSPKGVYDTLALLEAAYPMGTTGIFVVKADGNWYYWSGAAWTAGGAYLGNQVSDGTDTWSESHSIRYVDGEPFFCVTLEEV